MSPSRMYIEKEAINNTFASFIATVIHLSVRFATCPLDKDYDQCQRIRIGVISLGLTQF